MKYILTVAALFVASASFADNFNATSKVTAVTAYGAAGVATRRADLDIPAGTHTITLRGSGLAAASEFLETIFPEGADLRLLSTQLNYDKLEPNRPPKSAEYQAKEAALATAQAQLDALEEQINVDQSTIASAQLRIEFLQTMAAGNGGVFGEDSTIDAAQVDGLIGSMGAQMQTAQQQEKSAQIRIAARQPERSDLINARDDAAQSLLVVTPNPSRGDAELVLTVKTDTGFNGPLLIRTFAQTYWQPHYRLALTQTGDTGVLRIERKVFLSQATGEDWTDVTVSLSTAALSQRQSASEPYSDIKRLIKPEEQYGKRMTSGSLQKDMASPQMDSSDVMEVVSEAGSSLGLTLIKGQTIEYQLTQPVSLRSGRQGGSLFELDATETVVDLFAQAHSAQDDKAYMYAEFENKTGGSILAGNATIYRDGAFVGTGQFPLIVNGDTTDLALGPIDGLLLDRRTVSREDGDRGLISSSNARELRYETKIESLLDYAIDLRLFDVVPTSESEDLVIREFLSPKPTLRDVDGKRGVLRWDVNIKPGTTKILKTGYDMVWPVDQQLR